MSHAISQAKPAPWLLPLVVLSVVVGGLLAGSALLSRSSPPRTPALSGDPAVQMQAGRPPTLKSDPAAPGRRY